MGQLIGDRIQILDTSPQDTQMGRLSTVILLSRNNYSSMINAPYQGIEGFHITEAYRHIDLQEKTRTSYASLSNLNEQYCWQYILPIRLGMSPANWKKLLHNNTSYLDLVTALIADTLLHYVCNIHLVYLLIAIIIVIIIIYM